MSYSVRRMAKLRMKKHREAERVFLAEGEELIGESPSPPVKLFSDTESVSRLSSLSTPVGPVAVFPFVDVSANELLGQRRTIVLLVGVQDPGNVGTVIRSAHAFGAGVALSVGTADLYNPKTVRATMGSLFHVPICRGVEASEFIGRARREDFTVAAAVSRGGEPPKAMSGRTLVVVGSEGVGLSGEVAGACDMSVSIPVANESLNAAVAASILLYAVC